MEMVKSGLQPVLDRISAFRAELTPKSRILAGYVTENPRQVMFMTVAELAKACGVSEATVVRFVGQLGYSGYAEFKQSLRDFVNTDLTLLDRMEMTVALEPRAKRFQRVVYEEMDNLRQLFEHTEMEDVDRVVSLLQTSAQVYVIGSRLSYSTAYYLGWSLTKIRGGIRILKGSDRTTIDWLTIAPADLLVIIVAQSRYPNELIRLGNLTKRMGQQLVVITDSTACPLLHCADERLVAPSAHIPLIGSPTTLSCLVNYLILELASRYGPDLKQHQEKLEQSYWENDVLFNMKRLPEGHSNPCG
ncbi:MAG: MurR/RpiR family transcriptional regulator [Desulfobacteraceae bacterium]|nr:MurR/RpiR family transcriptional regulator [Desulfobacteraceae bacterium]MDD3991181.1 MurR/RpiR family transcriptional regulator [Desulfobacteraceae bacterium]